MKAGIAALAVLAACASSGGGARSTAAGAAPAGESITPGRTLTGRLTLADPQFRDGARYRRYDFTAAPGDTVSFGLASDDFDAYIIVTDRFGNPLTHDDDSGGDCNAALTYGVRRATATPFRVYATSSARAELGEYRLTMTRGARRAARDSTCRGLGQVQGLILPGETVSGTLTADDPEMPDDSSYFHRWVLPLAPGQTVTVDLTSDAFDAYLLLTRGRGDKVAEDDDGGGGCNARIVYTAVDEHPLRIIVNTVKGRVTGAYTLQVTNGKLPVALGRDCPDDGVGSDD